MISFFVKRFLLTLPVLFGVSTLTFMLLHFVPGDPVDAMLGPQASFEDRERLRSDLGLNLPLKTQYLHFMSELSRGNLGRSLVSRNPVTEEILSRFPATLELTLAAIFLAMLIGIPTGILAAKNHYKLPDKILSSFGLLFMSIPGFWLGPMLILIFAIHLDWLPISERTGLSSVVLPALSLALSLSAILMRMTRTSMLEVLKEDYIRTAHAKGVAPLRVYFKHAFKNALMPVITILGLQFGALLTGTVITETVFDWPGIGTLFFQAIQQRNYPLVQGCVLFISTIYVVTNLCTDIAYAFANPKVRLE